MDASPQPFLARFLARVFAFLRGTDAALDATDSPRLYRTTFDPINAQHAWYQAPQPTPPNPIVDACPQPFLARFLARFFAFLRGTDASLDATDTPRLSRTTLDPTNARYA